MHFGLLAKLQGSVDLTVAKIQDRVSIFADDERHVMATKAKGVVHCILDAAFAGGVGDEIYLKARFWVFEIDGGGNDPLAHCVDASDQFDCAASAQTVTVHALCAAHQEVSGAVAA